MQRTNTNKSRAYLSELKCSIQNFFCIVLSVDNTFNRISGDDSWVVPPVPIPNTVVKHSYAESTCLETDWEDRALPVFPYMGFFIMAALVKRLTHWIVAPACMGSIPIYRPILKSRRTRLFLAKKVRRKHKCIFGVISNKSMSFSLEKLFLLFMKGRW